MTGADLRPPPLRSGLVFRRDLVETLTSTDADVITLVAPKGYGKTTALAQWVREETARVAWLKLRRENADAKSLFHHLAASIRRVGLMRADDLAYFKFLGDVEPPSGAVDYFADLLQASGDQVLIVVDNAQFLRTRAALDLVTELVNQLEGVARIALASNLTPNIGLPVLRAKGRLLEVTSDQLALSVEEVERLTVELGLDQGIAPDIVKATEGWPAAVYLTAVAAGDPHIDLAHREFETRRHLHEFVRSEIISHLSARRRRFLTLMSPLRRMSGPLCDVVSRAAGSQRLLDSLERDTHLISQMDNDGSWYAMNRVLRDALRAELRRDDPEAAIEVHSRAARWYEENNMPLEAIGHAARAGETEAFARLMELLVKSQYVDGQVGDVLMWMDWLDKNVSLADYPRLAAIGALVHIQEGNVLATERWLDASSQGRADSEAEAVSLLVRALSTRSGVADMVDDIDMAAEAGGPGSRWAPAILVAKGLAHMMNGEADTAEPLFIEAATLGLENESVASAILALGHRALLAIERHEWDLADQLSDQALALIEEHSLDTYYASGPALVAAARCARHRNEIAKTQNLLARASNLRSRFSVAMPGVSVLILLEMVKAHVELSDTVSARAMIREAEEIVLQRPDLGVLAEEVGAAKEHLANLGPGRAAIPALTKAELRLLPLLATHLSFPEIGEQLFVSRHTVKSQATSIYRKLNSSTRSEAVARAHDIGLLTH